MSTKDALRAHFHGRLELEGIGDSIEGRMKKNKPYFCACTRLARIEIVFSLASSLFSPCNSIFQGRHARGKARPFPLVPICHGNTS
jgi:hypothetical protein